MTSAPRLQMAFIIRLARLVPLAVRLSLAGGAAYGSAKVGVWSDSSGSQDKLRKVRESWPIEREIEYPTVSPQPEPWRSAASVSFSTIIYKLLQYQKSILQNFEKEMGIENKMAM